MELIVGESANANGAVGDEGGLVGRDASSNCAKAFVRCFGSKDWVSGVEDGGGDTNVITGVEDVVGSAIRKRRAKESG